MYHTVERTYHTAGYTYHSVKHTYHSVGYRFSASKNTTFSREMQIFWQISGKEGADCEEKNVTLQYCRLLPPMSGGGAEQLVIY